MSLDARPDHLLTQEVTVHLWAGARAAAGVSEVRLPAATVADVTTGLVERYAALAPVLPLCALLRGGQRLDLNEALSGGDVVEVLPPFAGG